MSYRVTMGADAPMACGCPMTGAVHEATLEAVLTCVRVREAHRAVVAKAEKERF